QPGRTRRRRRTFTAARTEGYNDDPLTGTPDLTPNFPRAHHPALHAPPPRPPRHDCPGPAVAAPCSSDAGTPRRAPHPRRATRRSRRRCSVPTHPAPPGPRPPTAHTTPAPVPPGGRVRASRGREAGWDVGVEGGSSSPLREILRQ